ncbi:MAG: FtsX-like permease family protein [Cyclobacteriaceae bacterium]
MIKNYLHIALRLIRRNRLYTMINLLGLALGIAISLLLLVHIKKEISYESNFPRHELIYRVASTYWAKMSPVLAESLRDEMPEIQSVGRLLGAGPKIVEHDEVQISTQWNFFADSSILDIFSLEFVYGNPEASLSAPFTAILTEQTAQRLFGPGVFPVGKSIQLEGYQEYTVTGVIKDLPTNTHLKIDLLASMSSSSVDTNDSRTWAAVSTYALFPSQGAARKVTSRLRDFQYRFLEGIQTREEIDREGIFYVLDPISDIHLHSHREKELSANSDIRYIYIFGALAALILLIACINFINLFTAQALKRGKEIAIRKANGAKRRQLIQQFLGEAFFMTLLASCLAIAFIILVLPWYNQMVTIPFSYQELFTVSHLLIFAGIILMTSLLSGAYPALHIAGYQIEQGLKSHRLPTQGGVFTFRKALMGVQFFISLLILICSVAVYLQINYIHDKDVGFDQDQVVAITLHSNLWWQTVHHKEKVRQELLTIAGVKEVSTATKLIGERFGWESIQLKDSEQEPVSARYIRTDEEFLNTLNIRLIEGDGFQWSADSATRFVINQKAAEQLQADQLVGQLAVNGYEGTIVGIVENFNFASLHQEVEPLVIEYNPHNPNYLLLRISLQNLRKSMHDIKAKIAEIAPGNLFIHQFLDNQLASLYETENHLFQIFRAFSGLSVLIACMGLFAVAAHSVELRTKEVGVRKVLGASVGSILLLLSKSYLKTLIITFLFAIPVANYLITEWLQNFAYRMPIYWWLYAVPALLILLFALLTISGQTIKAARKNPVESLRYE